MHTQMTFGYGDHIREEAVLTEAAAILERRMMRAGTLSDPALVKSYLVAKLSGAPNERFHVIWLDSRHQIIASETLFHGGIDGAEVHPRVIVQRALHHNAAAVIICHNHPSTQTSPSASDRVITRRISDALALIETRLLDHIIVGGTDTYSFAEQGLL